MDRGWELARNGEPETGVSLPFMVLIVYPETSSELKLATYTKWPLQSVVIALGLLAATTVPTNVSAPLLRLIR